MDGQACLWHVRALLGVGVGRVCVELLAVASSGMKSMLCTVVV